MKTQEIKPSSDETYSDLQELADDLPDSSPRFVLLSYPLTLVRFALPRCTYSFSFSIYLSGNSSLLVERADHITSPRQPSGRLSVPYVLLYYLPVNSNPNLRMSYAGAVELFRGTAEVNRVLEVSEAEDVVAIEAQLKGED